MAALFLDVALRATLITAGAACVLWILRVRTAAERHAAWTAVLLSMLFLPIYSLAGPRLPLAVLPAIASSSDLVPSASPEAGTGGADLSVTPLPLSGTVPSHSPDRFRGAWLLVGLYCLVAFALLTRLAIGTVHARRLRRQAVNSAGRATSVRCATPISVGWWSPVLILPDGWQHWSSGHLAAVLTHEHEHLRRRDPLIQWFALFNRAILWFHPLAWWLARRLSTLAEEACDAAVLRAGHSPQDYVGYLIDMAHAVNQKGRRLNVAGMAMAGGGLPARVRLILQEGSMTPRSRTRVLCTLGFCATSSMVCIALTLAPRPSASALSQGTGAKAAADVPDAKSLAPVLQTRSAGSARVREMRERPRPDSSRRDRGGPPQVTQAKSSDNGLLVGPTARTVVVVIDDLRFTPSETRNALDLLALLRDESVTEADLVGIVSTGPSSVATDPHSPADPQRLNDAIQRIAGGHRLPAVERPLGSPDQRAESRYHAQIAVWTATDVVRHLAGVAGRSKLLVFVRSAETAATTQEAAVADPEGKLARDVAALTSAARLGNVTMRMVDAGDRASADVLRP